MTDVWKRMRYLALSVFQSNANSTSLPFCVSFKVYFFPAQSVSSASKAARQVDGSRGGRRGGAIAATVAAPIAPVTSAEIAGNLLLEDNFLRLEEDDIPFLWKKQIFFAWEKKISSR